MQCQYASPATELCINPQGGSFWDRVSQTQRACNNTCKRPGTRSCCSNMAAVKGWACGAAIAVGVYSWVEIMTMSRLTSSQSNR